MAYLIRKAVRAHRSDREISAQDFDAIYAAFGSWDDRRRRMGRRAALRKSTARHVIAVVNTSILIDVLRGRVEARDLLATELRAARLHGSEVCRLEVLSGMRSSEADATRELLNTRIWSPVDRDVAVRAGEIGCRHPPANRGIDAADLAIAATTSLPDARVSTSKVRHLPMFADLTSPYESPIGPSVRSPANSHLLAPVPAPDSP